MTRSSSRSDLPTRRHVVRGLASAVPAAIAAPLAAIPHAAEAQTASPTLAISRGHWRELGDLAAEASRLGFTVPRFGASLSAQDPNDFGQVMRSTVDLIETVDLSERPASAAAEADDTERLSRKAHALLRRINQLERSPPSDPRLGPSATTAKTRPTFESVKAEYDKLFASCTVREKNRSDVNWNVSKLSDQRYQKQWLAAAQEVCCPWYFVGLIHAMECSFDFKAHLHNGDPLSEKTIQVPKGRPSPWNPPSDWVSSAKDALTYDGFADATDWSIARTLYRLEAYNGFGSRRNGINTPYLWSFSNHYARGKFVADGVWDASAVSKQCGAAVVLKVLVEKGIASPPA